MKKTGFNTDILEDARITESTARDSKALALMAEPKNMVGEPCIDCTVELIEFAGEEVVRSFHDNQMVFTG